MVISYNLNAAEVTTVHVNVGKVSEVSFPENISKVIKGGAADSILVEAVDRTLYILPKSNTPADIFVTGASGTSYPLSLQISQAHDLSVVIGGKTNSFKGDLNVMDLMKDVLLGNIPAGSTQISLHRTITLKDSPIELSFTHAYEFPTTIIYELSAKNLNNSATMVPIQQISYKGILAIASNSDILNPSGQEGDETKIWMITSKN